MISRKNILIQHFMLGLCAISPLTAQTTIEPRIASQTAASGGLTQIKVDITSPRPISEGTVNIVLDSSLESLDNIAMFSPAGDTYGMVLQLGPQFVGTFYSPSLSLGTATEYPLMVVDAKLRTGIPESTAIPVNFASSTYFRGGYEFYATPVVRNGLLNVAGNLSVSSIIPGGGPLSAGSTIRLFGTGFDAATRVTINGVPIQGLTVMSPTELRFSLSAAADLTGKSIRVRNDVFEVQYFSYLHTTRVGVSGTGIINNMHPIFPNQAVTGAGISMGPELDFRVAGFAFQNSSQQAVQVELELISPGYHLLGKTTVTLPPLSRYVRSFIDEFHFAPDYGSIIRLVASSPIQVLGFNVWEAGLFNVYPAFDLPPAATPRLWPEPSGLFFRHTIGRTPPPPQQLNITGEGAQVSFRADSHANWLTVTPRDAQTPANLMVSVNPAGLADGGYSSSLTLVKAGASDRTVPVTLIVGPPCQAAPAAADLVKALPAGGGQFYVDIVAPLGCPWTVQSTVPWISVGTPSGTGNAFIILTAQENPSTSPRTTQLQAASGVVQITQAGLSCSYAFSPEVMNFRVAGGPGVVQLTTSHPSCAWTLTPNANWITITSATSGAGSTTIQFVVAATTTARQGFIQAGGSSLRIDQSGPDVFACAYSLFPTAANYPSTGGFGTFQLTTLPLSCPWTVTSDANWILLNSETSGVGATTIHYAVDSTTTARQGSIQVGGRSFVITQSGQNPPTCSYTFATQFANFSFSGGPGSVRLTSAPASCTWNVVTDANWITIQSATAGSGETSINYTVAPTQTSRQGFIQVGAVKFLVTQSALRFVPVSPCRAVDTRVTGQGAPSLAAQNPRDFDVRTAPCGIPTNAAAYSLNVTAVPKSASLSFLTVWPAGQTRPLASTLNAWDGRVVANAALIPAGANGGVSVFASDTTDIILDVNGYFVPNTEPAGLAFFPLPPCRISDTRLTRAMLQATVARDFDLLASGCGVPVSARAYSLNLTAIPQTTLGYLSVWPTGQAQPLVSTLNSWNGQITANAAIVPAGTGGKISLFASNNSDVIIDINGYFAPVSVGGLSYYPVTPCRISDTRSSSGFSGAFGAPMLATGVARTFPIPSSNCSIPSSGAYAINFTAVPLGPLAFLSTGPGGNPQPAASTLNSFNGQVVANLALIPAGSAGGVSAWVSGTTDLILDITGYFQP